MKITKNDIAFLKSGETHVVSPTIRVSVSCGKNAKGKFQNSYDVEVGDNYPDNIIVSHDDAETAIFCAHQL